MLIPTQKAGQEANRFIAAGLLADTITLPAAAGAGNVLVLALAGDKNIGTLGITDAIGGGWNLPVNTRAPNTSLAIAWKPAVGGELAVNLTLGANVAGAQAWIAEYEQVGGGVWQLRALSVNGSDDSTVTAWSSGTTGAAGGDGIAVAAFSMDSMTNGGTPGTYTGGYAAQRVPTGTGAEAGLWVADAPVLAGATTGTTLTRGGGTADQMSGGVIVLGRVTVAGTRINLLPNPACKVSASQWFGVSGWARSTTVTGLERTTGFAGTAAGDVITPKFTAAAGAPYVVSLSVHAVAAQNATISVDWYDAAGAFVTGTDGLAWTAAAGAVTRLESGPVICPSGATRGLVVLSGLDGSAQITAVLVEQTTETGRGYFDGDTPGASWSSTPGNSTSYLLVGADSFVLTDGGSMLPTVPGPVGGDGIALVESATGQATGITGDELHWAEYALIVASTYDDRYGRIRVEAHGFPATAIRAVVYSRPATSSTWREVRGGRVTVSGGAMSRWVDDYEFAAGVTMHYRIVALASSEDEADEIVATAQMIRLGEMTGIWLKFISAPWLNRRLRLIGWSDISRASRNASYDVAGRRTPVVVTDVHSGRRFSITCETFSIDETEDLDEALRAGYPVYFHTPATAPPPTIYAAVGDYSWSRPANRSVRARFEVPLIEVSAPPPSVFGAATTYQTLLEEFASYADLLAGHDIYAELL